MRILFFLLIFFIDLFHLVYAQTKSNKEIEIQQVIQTIFANQNPTDVLYEDFYESLIDVYNQPLDLNKATKDELAFLFILSETQLIDFFLYRGKYGKLISLYELQVIPSFDLETIHQLLFFVTIDNSSLEINSIFFKQLIKESSNYFLVRYESMIESSRGFKEKKYQGSPYKMITKFRMGNKKTIQIGLTAEKDVGEKLKIDPSSNQYGSDFYTGYLSIENKKWIKKLIIGDYRIQTGQSLLVGMGFTLGKGSEVIASTRKSNQLIQSGGSLTESGFFRGIVTSLKWNRFSITPFFSSIQSDASIQYDSISHQSFVSTRYQTGLHRTSTEIATKNKLKETTMGFNVHYSLKNPSLQIGVNFIRTNFNFPIKKNSNYYSLFDFEGKKYEGASIYSTFSWQNFQLINEYAQSNNKGRAILIGLIGSMGSQIDLAFLYRNYARNFQHFYANGFGEKRNTQNEEGIYTGIKIYFTRKITLSSYIDIFRFPWLSYGIYTPSVGYDFLLKLHVKLSKTSSTFFQFRFAAGQTSSSDLENKLPILTDFTRKDITYNLDYQPIPKLNFHSRIQYSFYQSANYFSAQGFLLVQDAEFVFKKIGFNARIAVFNADDYITRQYIYEQDVLYAFSFPAYFNMGVRSYFLVKWKINKTWQAWMRISRTIYENTETIGSDLNEIDGNIQTQIHLQLKINF